MDDISRLIVTFVIVLLVGLPILSDPVDAFDGEFVLEAELSFFGDYRYIYLSPTGDRVCVATDDRVYIVDVETQTVLVEMDAPGTVGRGCWAGEYLYFLMHIRENVNPVTYFVVMDPEDLSEVTRFKPPRTSIHTMASSPTGDHVAFTSRGSGRPGYPVLYVLRTSDNEIEYTFQDGQSGSHSQITWSINGERVATATDEDIYIHDVEDGSTFKMDKKDTRSMDLVFTPDGNGLYSFNREGTIDLYDLVRQEHVDTTNLAQHIECGDIDFDRGLVCLGEWYDLRLYSLGTSEALERHPDAADEFTQVEWFNGGYRIVTISEDGFLRFYRDTSDPDWNTPPVITITSPTWGQEVQDNLVASGTIIDDGTVVEGSFSLNRGPWLSLEHPEAWSFDILAGHMVQGSNQLTVTASDGESVSTETVFFRFTGSSPPNVAPTVEILSPVDGSEVGNAVIITGTAADDVAVASVLIQIGEGTWMKATGSEEWEYFAVFSPDIDGKVTVRARSNDGSLDSQVEEIELVVDRDVPSINIPPRVILEYPLDGMNITDTLVCKGITEDEGTEPTTFIAFDGGAWTLLSTSPSWERSFQTSDWMEGPHSISFMAFDGELASTVVKVRVVLITFSDPIIQVLEPSPGERFSESLTISGNAMAGRGGIIRVEVRTNGGPWMLAQGNETWSLHLDLDNFPFGDLKVEARAWDERTNSTITSVDIVNEGDTPRESEPDYWWVWLLVLILVGVASIILWSRKRGQIGHWPKGPTVMAITLMAFLFTTTLTQDTYGATDEQEYDFQMVKEVAGIRNFRHMFTSPDQDSICVINSSYDPDGYCIRIYNFTADRFVAETWLHDIVIQDGCWVRDRILLATHPRSPSTDPIDPIYILSSHDLSFISTIRPVPEGAEDDYYYSELRPSPSGEYIAASRLDLVIFRIEDNAITHHFDDDYGGYIRGLAWSPDETRIALLADNGWFYNLEDGTVLETHERFDFARKDLFWSPNGSQVCIIDAGYIHIYDGTTAELLQKEWISHRLYCWGLNPMSNEMIWGDETDIGITSLEDLSFVTKFEAAIDTVEDVIWDLEGYRVIVMTDKGVMRIFLDGDDPQANQPPVIIIVNPIEGEEVLDDISAEGTVTDDVQVINARYKLNDGDWVDLSNPLFWSVDLSLTDMVEGDNTLTVSASDGDLISTSSVIFHVAPDVLSNYPPTVIISVPGEDDRVGVLIEVEGTAYDDHGVTMVLVRIGDGMWTLARGTTEWSASLVVPTPVLPGKVMIEAKAWDDRSFSPVVGVNVTLVLDGPSLNERPQVTIESPSEGEVILGDGTVTGRTYDDSDLVTTLVAIDGGSMETLTTDAVWERELSQLGPGEHSVSVIASDGLLVSGVATVNFTLMDYEPLRVIISSPEEGAEVVGEVMVSGVVLGGLDDIGSVELRLDGGEWTELNPERSWQILLPLEGKRPGEHLVEVRAWDDVDGSPVASVSFVLVTDEGPEGPREPDLVYIWLILVIVIVFIIAFWRARQSRSS